MKNKKGFTLIELLAVITILAVVMLIAAVGVLPMIENSRKKSLINEGRVLVKAAELAYSDKTALNVHDRVIISMQYLHDLGYYDKGAEDGYFGSVKIDKSDNGELEKRYYISDSKFAIDNADINTDFDKIPVGKVTKLNNLTVNYISQGGERSGLTMYNLGAPNVFKTWRCNYAYATSDTNMRKYFNPNKLGTPSDSDDNGIETGSI